MANRWWQIIDSLHQFFIEHAFHYNILVFHISNPDFFMGQMKFRFIKLFRINNIFKFIPLFIFWGKNIRFDFIMFGSASYLNREIKYKSGIFVPNFLLMSLGNEGEQLS